MFQPAAKIRLMPLFALVFLLLGVFSSQTSATTLSVTSGTLHVSGGIMPIEKDYIIEGDISVNTSNEAITFYNNNLTAKEGDNTGWVFPFGVSGENQFEYDGEFIFMVSCAGLTCPTFSGSYDGETLVVDGSYHDQATTDGFSYRYQFTAQVVPIPGAAWMFASALIGLAGVGRHKMSK